MKTHRLCVTIFLLYSFIAQAQEHFINNTRRDVFVELTYSSGKTHAFKLYGDSNEDIDRKGKDCLTHISMIYGETARIITGQNNRKHVKHGEIFFDEDFESNKKTCSNYQFEVTREKGEFKVEWIKLK